MKLDITGLSYEAKWYDFKTGEVVDQPGDDGAFLKIKPHPFSKSNVIVRDKDILISGEEQCKIFKESLEEWKGFIGNDDQPIKLTDDVKQILYDFRVEGVSDFVINKVWAYRRRKEDAEQD